MGFYNPYALPPIKPDYKRILEKNHTFYQSLSPDEKRQFEKRVQHFIHLKTFIPRGISHVTDEMKTLISATVIQLTFGLPRVYLKQFKKILIYPNDYYSQISKQYHSREVKPKYGLIMLSWSKFVRENRDPYDGTNSGLHEMVHALHLENIIRNKGFGFLDDELLSRWDHLVEQEITTIDKEQSLFRDYAVTNKYDFFAYAIELLFEKEQELRIAHPEIHRTIKKLLRL